ncbi:MAG: CHC2 zinc finger domain-containing protein [Isosphaeraceae bacterium]
MNARRNNPWRLAAGKARIDWDAIRDRVDLAKVVTALLGPAPGRRGEKSRRRLWWRCPLGTHEDGNPSFCVAPGKGTWKCWGCGERGDAAELVMRLKGWTFPEAARWLAEQAGIATASTSSRPAAPSGGTPSRPMPPAAKPGKAPAPAPETPSGLPLTDALKLVEDAAVRIWTPEGRPALEYLHGRGLGDETIKAARLGWTPGVMIPKCNGVGYWRSIGVVIPWLDGDRLTLVKIRQLEGRKPKYGEAYRDRPGIFPSPAVIEPGKPLVVTEGEFDCLLLGQALGDMAAVATLGSASSRPDPPARRMMRAAPVWYLAHDADGAGDKAASGWPARAVRVRPPAPHKDWGELHAAGFNLIRYFWHRILATPTPWEEMARARWGGAVGDPEPGIIIDKPDRGRLSSVPEAAVGGPNMQGTLFPTASGGKGAYP